MGFIVSCEKYRSEFPQENIKRFLGSRTTIVLQPRRSGDRVGVPNLLALIFYHSYLEISCASRDLASPRVPSLGPTRSLVPSGLESADIPRPRMATHGPACPHHYAQQTSPTAAKGNPRAKSEKPSGMRHVVYVSVTWHRKPPPAALPACCSPCCSGMPLASPSVLLPRPQPLPPSLSLAHRRALPRSSRSPLGCMR